MFRSTHFVLFVLGYIALGESAEVKVESCNIQSDPSTSLLSMLKNFNGARNHQTQPEGKQKARDFIINSLKKYGLHVWTERATIGNSLEAENLVGMIPSSRTGTDADKIVIVGAHYDTEKNTRGIDDNGSGVTSLLQVAKNIGEARCHVKNTVLFVAFDFEESTNGCNITGKIAWPIACGSNRYVKNLTSYLEKTGGTVSGAIILETMLNHNSSAGSQVLPQGFNIVLSDAYAEVKNDSNRGNFLAVIGRKESDKKLLSLIEKHFVEDKEYRVQPMRIPIPGRQSLSPMSKYFDDLYRSDHYEFWEANASYSALMLGDTANFRGYMTKCYHHECDDLRNVKEDDLEFLRRTTNAVIKTVLDLSEVETCTCSSGGVGVTFDMILMLLLLLGTFLF